MTKTVSLSEILKELDAHGQEPEPLLPATGIVDGFCSLSRCVEGRLTWSRFVPGSPLVTSKCVVIAPAPSTLKDFPGALNIIRVKDPKSAFFSVLEVFWAEDDAPAVATSAVVLGSLGENVSVGEHSYIGPDVRVGDGTRIGHSVTICCPCTIGSDCVIASGVVIGTDGFGYYQEDGVPHRVRHFGGVTIGDRVEIGANTCIDRGTIDDTTIGDDVKMDNLVHIGHNVSIKSRAMVVAGVTMCGSTNVGAESYIGPNATIRNQLAIGQSVTVGMGAVVNQDLPEGILVTAKMGELMRVPKRLLKAFRDDALHGR